MRKLAEEVVRFNCRLPKVVADWVGEKAKNNGVTLSEEVRHMLIDVKSGEDFLKQSAKALTSVAEKKMSI